MANVISLNQAVEFAENPEPRCPCVLLLDTSGSMNGAAINALNEGLKTFKDDLNRDALVARRVEIAIITFNSEVQIIQDFITADQFAPPTLLTSGLTRMGSAINTALDILQSRKREYRNHGVVYYRPWVFMITDGEPQGDVTGAMEQARQRLVNEEEHKRVAFFAVGVENANISRLSEIVVRTPLKLKGLNFQEMFLWLSASMMTVSHSSVDEQVSLPPVGWSYI